MEKANKIVGKTSQRQKSGGNENQTPLGFSCEAWLEACFEVLSNRPCVRISFVNHVYSECFYDCCNVDS